MPYKTKEEKNRKAREYYYKNKNKCKKRFSIYWRKTKDARKEYNKKRHEEYERKNADKISVRKGRYYVDNKEYIDNRNKRYNKKNRVKVLEITKNWYLKNKDRVRINQNNWYKTENGRRLQKWKNHRRRIKEKNLKVRLTKKEYEFLFKKYKRCLCCGILLERLPKRDRTQDHVLPINKDGEDTLKNSIVLCRSCNGRKQDRIMTLDELKKETQKKSLVEEIFIDMEDDVNATPC